MWLAYYTQAEIAQAIGYAEGPVSQFLKSIKEFSNGIGAVSEESAENSGLVRDVLRPKGGHEDDEPE